MDKQTNPQQEKQYPIRNFKGHKLVCDMFFYRN